MKLATEPSRTDALTAYFRTRVLPANTLNGELTRHGSTVKSCRSPAKAGRAHGKRHQGTLDALIAPPGWPSTTLLALSREAVPALFGVLKLRQYLCSHVRMTLLVWMHVECVPICLVQIDLDRVNIGREGFAL